MISTTVVVVLLFLTLSLFLPSSLAQSFFPCLTVSTNNTYTVGDVVANGTATAAWSPSNTAAITFNSYLRLPTLYIWVDPACQINDIPNTSPVQVNISQVNSQIVNTVTVELTILPSQNLTVSPELWATVSLYDVCIGSTPQAATLIPVYLNISFEGQYDPITIQYIRQCQEQTVYVQTVSDTGSWLSTYFVSANVPQEPPFIGLGGKTTISVGIWVAANSGTQSWRAGSLAYMNYSYSSGADMELITQSPTTVTPGYAAVPIGLTRVANPTTFILDVLCPINSTDIVFGNYTISFGYAPISFSLLKQCGPNTCTNPNTILGLTWTDPVTPDANPVNVIENGVSLWADPYNFTSGQQQNLNFVVSIPSGSPAYYYDVTAPTTPQCGGLNCNLLPNGERYLINSSVATSQNLLITSTCSQSDVTVLSEVTLQLRNANGGLTICPFTFSYLWTCSLPSFQVALDNTYTGNNLVIDTSPNSQLTGPNVNLVYDTTVNSFTLNVKSNESTTTPARQLVFTWSYTAGLIPSFGMITSSVTQSIDTVYTLTSSLTLNFTCNPAPAEPYMTFQTLFEYGWNSPNNRIITITKYCPQAEPTSTGPFASSSGLANNTSASSSGLSNTPNTSSSELNGAAIFFIVFFVLLFVLCVIGCVYNSMYQQKRGLEIIPFYNQFEALKDKFTGPKNYTPQMDYGIKKKGYGSSDSSDSYQNNL